MIENPPKTLSQTSLPTDALFKMLTNPENNGLFEKIEREYLYWDKIKYMSPGGVRPEDLWAAVKLIRQTSAKSVKFGNYRFLFKETNYMQQFTAVSKNLPKKTKNSWSRFQKAARHSLWTARKNIL